jgi:outer membrane biosynthesis protein TonB
VVIILTSTIYDNMTFVSHIMEQTNPQETKTLEIEFNLPPPEEEKTQENIQQLIHKDLNIQNAVQDQEAKEGNQNYVGETTEPTKNIKVNTQSAADEVREFEKQLFAEASGNSQRSEIQKQRAETERKKQQFEQDQKNKQTNNNPSQGTSSKKGKTMVSYSLTGRKPHNNDISNVRNPGYTCEQGSYGEVTIKIKVNSLGQVESATPASSYSNLNSCLVEQALKYAKLSRFDASDKSSQDGTITYIFMP